MRGIVEFAFYDRTRKSFRNRREVFSNRRSDGAVENEKSQNKHPVDSIRTTTL